MTDLLVVDDSEFFLELVSTIAGSHGWSVSLQRSLDAAERALPVERPTIVIVATWMHDGLGRRLAKLAQDGSPTFMIGVGRHVRHRDWLRHRDAGIAMVLDKATLQRRDLDRLLRVLMARPQSTNHLRLT